jgi:ubiquinone/menaquinone biosynthesis C-methylase UbiE
MKKKSFGYNTVSGWYDNIVKDKGHYYHKNVIIPNVLKYLKNSCSILDLACGQGVLQRYLDQNIQYLGIDISNNLIDKANLYNKNKNHFFLKNDLNELIELNKKDFDAATIILSFQDINNSKNLLLNAYNHLKKNGKLILVINHPCFRVLKHSSWGIDEINNIQYRRVDRYLSNMKIPFSINPSKENRSKKIFSYHHSLSSISNLLYESNFLIEKIDELISDKNSIGAKAKIENQARKEIPLFMAVIAIKK